ncbi:MAG TPA: single-stranded DNA-binding protein [Firmicutes bacterium]|jgi:single-strand DNA-binding protein|nr:single-stranded DNA-binding protein [Bacillota bacterium]
MRNAVLGGKITKVFTVKTGVKAQMELPDGANIFIQVSWDGATADRIKESEGKNIVLVGTLRFKKDIKFPVYEVNILLNGGGFVVLEGNLTRDAELKYSQNGKQMADFSIAVNHGWGERKETDFVSCRMFGNDKEKNPAVTMAEKGAKGRKILVAGYLSQNEKDGKVYNNIIVDEYRFLEAPKKQQSSTDDYDQWANAGTNNVTDDEIPF